MFVDHYLNRETGCVVWMSDISVTCFCLVPVEKQNPSKVARRKAAASGDGKKTFFFFLTGFFRVQHRHDMSGVEQWTRELHALFFGGVFWRGNVCT